MDKSPGKPSSNKVINEDKQEVAPGNLAKYESCLLKVQAGIQVFLSPDAADPPVT